MNSSRFISGLSIIEIIITAAIVVTLVTAAASAWQLNIRISNVSMNQSQAALILEETGEILQLLRDENWTRNIAPLTLGTTYQLAWSNNKYITTTTQNIIRGKYVRTFTLSSVNRDTNDNITSTGGTLDSNTKKVAISIFVTGSTSTPILQSEMLIHNVYAN
ncbi:MAG: hypothetical protein M3Q80_01620 [bacterium]|nr:hypothetical protein [bacterium]